MKTDDRNIPGEAAAGCGWNNRLPAWIRSDPAYKDLRQGPLHTLQVIADRCDGPLRDDNAAIIGSATLLVCFGGKRLIKECGCWPSTFWSHMRTLQALGYVVPLTNGGGHLASVYGIPGRHGELDAYRAKHGDKARLWKETDTSDLRRLVSGNRTLAEAQLADPEPSGNRTAGARKPDGSLPKIGQQPTENRTLPSPLPSSSTSAHKPSSLGSKKSLALQDDDAGRPSSTRNTINGLLPKVEQSTIESETRPRPPGTNPVFRKLALKLPDGAVADEVQMVLRSNGVDPGRAYKLAWNPHVTPAMIRDVLGRVIPHRSTIENPGGYIGNLINDEITKARAEEREREAQAFEAEQQRLAEAEAAIDTMPDDELQEVIKSIGVLKTLSPAEVRADPVFRAEVARRQSNKREVDFEPVGEVPT